MLIQMLLFKFKSWRSGYSSVLFNSSGAADLWEFFINDNFDYNPKKYQRRAHSLSGCANLDSTPLLLGGTGVYCPPQSHYCSWTWNRMYLFRVGWNPIRSTPFGIFVIPSDLLFLKLPLAVTLGLTGSSVSKS